MLSGMSFLGFVVVIILIIKLNVFSNHNIAYTTHVRNQNPMQDAIVI